MLIDFNCMEQPGYPTKNLLLFSMDERKSKRQMTKPSISPLKKKPRKAHGKITTSLLSLSHYWSVYFVIARFKQLETNEMTELSLSATAMTSPQSHSEFTTKTTDRRAHSHLNEQCTCQSHTLSTQTQPHSVLNTPGQNKKSDNNIKTF